MGSGRKDEFSGATNGTTIIDDNDNEQKLENSIDFETTTIRHKKFSKIGKSNACYGKIESCLIMFIFVSYYIVDLWIV